MTHRTDAIAAKIEAFVRSEVVPYRKIREGAGTAPATNSCRNYEPGHARLAS